MLRVGDVVTIEGAGSLQSGNWLVWSVRHRSPSTPGRCGSRSSATRSGPRPQGPAASARLPAAGDRRRRCDRRPTTAPRGSARAAAHAASTASTAASSPTSTPATLRIKAKVPAVLGDDRDRLVHALRPLRRAERRHRVPARDRQRRVDRVRGRRRLLPDLDRLLLARGRGPAGRRAPGEGDRHRGAAQAQARRRPRLDHASPTPTATR